MTRQDLQRQEAKERMEGKILYEKGGKTMNLMTDEELARQYDAGYLTRHAISIEEEIKRLKDYVIKVYSQGRKSLATPVRKVVQVRKNKWGTTRIEIYVSLHHKPEGVDNVSYPVTHSKKFYGSEKKAAREYRDALALEHGATVEGDEI